MSYKRLGDCIKRVSIKNSDGLVDILYGINIDKFFMPSVANVIGTDLSRYKVVTKNQFACNRMHVGRDKRLPISLSLKNYDFIVSPAYDVFEITDTDIISSEYLMMWFTREEFDRNCWFHTDSDVRGKLDWDAFMDMELPVPSLEKQQQIVAEYNTVTKRIQLNEKINTNLEATAQALYKHWFVDFEFPNAENKPYKSSGGQMVYNEELDKDIPVGWGVETVGDVIQVNNSNRIPIAKDERVKIKGIYPYYGAAALMDFINDYKFDGRYILLGEDGSVINQDRSPVLQYVWGKFWVNNHAHVLSGANNNSTEYINMFLKNLDVSGIITGGVQSKINQSNLKSLKVLKKSDLLVKLYSKLIDSMFEQIRNNSHKSKILQELQSLLLAKMTKIEVEKEMV